MRHIHLSHLGFHNLLFWMLLYLIISPFLAALPYATFILEACLTAVLLSAVYAVRKSKPFLYTAVALLVVSLMLQWMGNVKFVPFQLPLTQIATALYLALLIYGFFDEIFRAKKVDLDLIAATLCLYLIIGVLWGTIYSFLESLSPSSFSGGVLDSAQSPAELSHAFNYFSFITLTTLGYGDITPQTQGAAALCQAEAIIGQFFVAVFVARLVGIEVAQRVKDDGM